MKRILLTITMGLLVFISSLSAQYVFNPVDFVSNGNAYYTGSANYVLTPDNQGKWGSVWYQNKVDLTTGFDLKFGVYLGSHDGADGLAFVLQPLNTGQGSSGGGMGYVGISPSLALELDTYDNGTVISDISPDHIALMKNGSNDHGTSNNLQGPFGLSDLEDGNYHSFRVVWDPNSQNLKAYVDGTLKINYTNDIVNSIFSGNPGVYFGLTAATGYYYNLQRFRIESLYFVEEFQITGVQTTPAECTDSHDGSINISVVPNNSNVTYSWSNGATTQDISGLNPGTYTVVATHTDGRSITKSYTVEQVDDTPPVANAKNISVELAASGAVTISPADIDNGSFDLCGIVSYELSQSTFTCSDYGQNQVLLTVKDAAGHTSSAAATVTVTGTDSDNDGVPDVCDLDDDNDGILDVNECTTSNFYWSNPPTISGKTATGTINGIAYTYTSSVNVRSTSSVFAYNTFPASYNVPNANPTIQNIEPSSNTLSFASPMTNPVLVFSSIGGGPIVVPINFSAPVEILWSNSTVHQTSATQITGQEGYAIVRMNGTFSSISFDYLVYENYVNFAFGADFFTYCDTDSDGIADYLDLDSDNDGCYDAIEGSLGLTPDQAPNGLIAGAVAPNGVPVAAGSQGQGVGTSIIASANCFCELGIDETNPVALAKDITVYLDLNGQASITPQDVDNGSNDNCGTVLLSLDDMTFDCADLGARNEATIVSDNTWKQSTVELVTPSQYVSVVNQLPALSTYTLSASNAWPYGTVNFFKPAIPGAQSIYANGGTKFYRNEFQLTGRPQSLRIRARVDNIMEIFVNGVSIGMEDDFDVLNFSNSIYHDVYIDDNGVQNGYLGGMQFDAVTSQSILDLLHAGSNEIVFAIANANGTDQGGFMVRMDAVADGVPVHLTATDANGNSSSATAFVVVKDNLAPVITTQPITVTLGANGTVSIIASDVAQATDNCQMQSLALSQYTFTATDAINSPVLVTVTATDTHNNISTAQVEVTVVDPVPVASCKDITVALDANGQATITPDMVDNGSSSVVGIASLTLDKTSFDCSNAGPNLVTLTVTSTLGSTATCTSTVTVVDNIAPVLTVPANMTVNTNTGLCGATVTFAASATDNCVATITYEPAPGSFFGKGLTTVMVTATDASGNATHGSFTVEVFDNEPPTITCPFDITISADPGVCGAIVNYNRPTATDNCGTGVLPTSLPDHTYKGMLNGHTYFLSNAPYPPEQAHARAIAAGGHLATISNAAENAFISAMRTDRIWIGFTDRDVEGTWKWINSEPVTYTNWSGGEPNNAGGNEDWAVINWIGPSWNDWYYTQPAYYVIEFDGGTLPTELVSGPESGSVFPVGTTEVTYSVTDDSGNSVECSFNVTVKDNEAPKVLTQSVTVELDENGMGSIVPSDVDAGSTDNCEIASMTLNISSFDCSKTGSNTVQLTVTDIHGNTSSAIASVTVLDKVAPIVLTQNITIQLDENGQASITPEMIDAGSSDACGIESLSLDVSSFDCSNVGSNAVSLTAVDVHGNSASATATVTVEDHIAPAAICQNTTIHLDENGQASIVPEDIDGGSTDACGIASLAASQLNFNCDHVGDNAITLTVTDVNGNVSTCVATVTVINDIPEINSYTVSPLVNIAETVFAEASYTDVNLASVEFDWGNGEVTSGTVDTGSGMVYGNHVYPEPGLYDVTVTITDVCGKTATETFSYVVIYDPCAGHVTGGGYMVEDGAKNNYGFNAKYDQGEQTPKANVTYQNKNLNFKFKANNAEWLMVNNDQAIFKGTGSVNNAGKYNYIVSFIDGDVVQKKDQDYFRIIIWDEFGQVYYDNQSGDADAARAVNPIGNGSLTIHKGCDTEEASTTTTSTTSTDDSSSSSSSSKGSSGKGKGNIAFGSADVTVYPNPVQHTLSLAFKGLEDQTLTFKITDLVGRTYTTDKKLQVVGGASQINISQFGLKPGNYVLMLRNEDHSYTQSKNFLKK